MDATRYSGDEYDESDCTSLEPAAGVWDEADDPTAQGQREGWDAACEAMFSEVGDDLYYGDDEVHVSQDDCLSANPY